MKDHYITWEGSEMPAEAQEARNRALASFRQTYHGVDGHISGRDGFSRRDWDSQRGGQPVKHSDIMLKANSIYYECSLIRNIIDLMADFTGQGLRISHPVKSAERFYRAWFKIINGSEISERFCNYLYRYANIIISKTMGRITRSEIKNYQSVAVAKIIPHSYTFINPAIVDVKHGDLSCFTKDVEYIITLPSAYATKIKKTDLIESLDKKIKDAIITGQPYVLDKESTVVYHYRKDDWCPWAKPILYSVFKDIDMLDMLELADRAALDGAISNLRIIKIGDVEKKMVPTEAHFERLDDVLQSHTPGGTIDIIWDEAISIEESSTEVHKFLGKDKYIPHLEKIYQGLGIPNTLAGAKDSGATNNFISLKTLLQRLEHGRSVLKSFWEAECEIVRQAMGFTKSPILEFDFSNLTDDTSYKALLIQLADRNLISDEVIQHAFNNNPELERARIVKEERQRDKGGRARKPGPYNEGDFEKLILRDALIKGLIDPTKTGVETIDKLNINSPQPSEKLTGAPGRPFNSKDKKARKRQKFNPLGSIAGKIAAKEAFNKVTEFLKPIVLKIYKKKALRDLTAAQYTDYDNLRVSMFFSLSTLKDIDDKTLTSLVGVKINNEFLKKINSLLNSVSEKLGREITQEDKAEIYSIIYNENSYRRNQN